MTCVSCHELQFRAEVTVGQVSVMETAAEANTSSHAASCGRSLPPRGHRRSSLHLLSPYHLKNRPNRTRDHEDKNLTFKIQIQRSSTTAACVYGQYDWNIWVFFTLFIFCLILSTRFHCQTTTTLQNSSNSPFKKPHHDQTTTAAEMKSEK